MKDREWSSSAVLVAVLVVAVSAGAAGLVLLRKRRLAKEKARRHFVRAACLLTDSKNASPEKARALAEEAIAEAEEAIRADAGDAAFHIVKSLALEAVGRSDAAIKEMGRALARPASLTVPERSGALVKRADLEARTGMAREALADLEDSVALTPTNAQTRVLLGEAYEKDGDVDRALEAFNKAVELDPASPGAMAAVKRLQDRGH